MDGCVITIIIEILFTLSIAAQHWSESSIIIFYGGHSSPNFTIDNKGIIHCVWVNQISSEIGIIYYSKSLNKGLTWSIPEDISLNNSLRLDNPQIISDSSDNIYVSYDYNVGHPNISVYYKKFDGTMWSSQYMLSDSMSSASMSKLAVDNKNRIFFFWYAGSEYYRYLDNNQMSEIYYAGDYSLGGWGFDKIIMDGQNRIHCVGSGVLMGQDIYIGLYLFLKDGEWSNPIELSNINFYTADVSVDNFYNPYFTWTVHEKDSSYLPVFSAYLLKDYHDSIGSAMLLSSRASSSAITVDKHNHTHIILNENIGHEYQLVHYYDYGGGWQTEIIDQVYLPTMGYGFYDISITSADSSVYLLYCKVDTSTYLPGCHNTPVIFRKYDLPLVINQEKQSIKVQTFPNPFSDYVIIQVEPQYKKEIVINIFNMKGQLILTRKPQDMFDGTYRYIWNGRDSNGNELNPGIYYAQILANNVLINCTRILLISK